jgi:Restriction endonuclease
MGEIGLRMIRQLDWRDFETLVDLIFSRGGWQRSSVLGKNQADVDLILSQPTIGETAWVQIKSGTSQAELDDCRSENMSPGLRIDIAEHLTCLACEARFHVAPRPPHAKAFIRHLSAALS